MFAKTYGDNFEKNSVSIIFQFTKFPIVVPLLQQLCYIVEYWFMPHMG